MPDHLLRTENFWGSQKATLNNCYLQTEVFTFRFSYGYQNKSNCPDYFI